MPPIQEEVLSSWICVLPGSWLSAEAKLWSNSFPDSQPGLPCPGLLAYSLLTKCALWSQLVGGRKPTAKQRSNWKPKMPACLVWYTVMHYPIHSLISPFTNTYCSSTARSCNARAFRSRNWKGTPMVVKEKVPSVYDDDVEDSLESGSLLRSLSSCSTLKTAWRMRWSQCASKAIKEQN